MTNSRVFSDLSTSLRAKRSNPGRKQDWIASSQGLLAMTGRVRLPGSSQSQRFSAEQRAVIAQDCARGVVAGGAGDAAAGMRAGAAMIEPLERGAIIRVP